MWRGSCKVSVNYNKSISIYQTNIVALDNMKCDFALTSLYLNVDYLGLGLILTDF